MAKGKTKAKGRNFAFILYPESLPEDWADLLESLGIPMAVSPLHDKDPREVKNVFELSDEETDLLNRGMLFKKAHYHVMYSAPNPVTTDGVRNKIKRKLGDNVLSHVEIVDNVEGYYKYLTHESSDAIKKNKPVYDKNEIKHLSNFDIDRYITLDEAQKKELFNAVTGAIYKHKIENLFELMDYVVSNGSEIGVESVDVLNDVIAPKTGLLRLYFDGAYQTRKEPRPQRFKPPVNVEEEKTENATAEETEPSGEVEDIE